MDTWSYHNNIEGKEHRMKLGSLLVSLLALIISVVSLLFNFFPQLNPLNTDATAKALAGDIDSQLFLANHYMDLGKYDDAILWYRELIKNKAVNQAKINTNLGFAYYLYNAENQSATLEKAFSCFWDAWLQGDEGGYHNLVILLDSVDWETLSSDVHEGIIYLIENHPASFEIAETDYVEFDDDIGQTLICGPKTVLKKISAVLDLQTDDFISYKYEKITYEVLSDLGFIFYKDLNDILN